ncbi:MAG: DNA topoisomerase VI subunit B [Thermoplasmatota archaeon]|nr:DNA topoisomerase VI subunit B [Candidatus Thermoplasmatota archaeon]MBU1914213.1 DNA topoisomerase VI subunit B [Candidatus Thermoplasmatota archaeon]
MSSIAHELAKKQKEISVSEFFEKNKQILGFDSLTRALITSVKEPVDNSLDACEDAGVLPEILVRIEKIDNTEYRVTVEDNGPGIVKKQVPNVFARLLYGSRFHTRAQRRGQQGIGVSAVVMYSQLTTGKATKVRSKISDEDVAYECDLILDTKKNRPDVIKEDFVIWDRSHGTSFQVHVKGKYIGGRQSIFEYLKGVAIVNPHAKITFIPPEGNTIVFERASELVPKPTKEVKPHPEGVELGELLSMAKYTESLKMTSFLNTEFSRISYRVAREICELAGVPPDLRPGRLTLEGAGAILEAIKKVKIMSPETDCLSPIGETLIRKGLKNVLGGLKADFYAPPVTREPKVFGGNPFIVEVGIVYGGGLNREDSVQILRFANRVPLMYQQGACAITQAVEAVDWRRYGLEQRGGQGIPYGPAIVLVHVASTKIPFTSESKEAVANIPEIKEEIELALKACARRLKTHLNKAAKKGKTKVKFEIVQEIIPMIAQKSAKIVGKPMPDLAGTITKIMNVVWIEDGVKFEKGRHHISVKIYNYTPKSQSFHLHILAPYDKIDQKTLKEKPIEIRENNKLTWDIKRIASTGIYELTFDLHGLPQEQYDENELYVSGIDAASVIGAEVLPGDWDLEHLKITEEGGLEEPEEGEEGEVDYDEGAEVINNEE